MSGDPAGPPAEFRITVNAVERTVNCHPDTPLLYVLRNDLGLLGTRFGCGEGLCGACNVLLDDVAVHSCDTPMWSVGDRHVTTVEGLTEQWPQVGAAFERHQAGQCGYCLSGIQITAAALLRRDPGADEVRVRAALDANLCRCGSHNRIVRAVLSLTESD